MLAIFCCSRSVSSWPAGRPRSTPYTLFYRARPHYAKAAVSAVTTADDGSPASQDVDVQLATAFQPILDAQTLPGKLPLLDIPPHVSVDRADEDSGASFVAEGAGIGLVRYSAVYSRLLPYKVASLIVLTRELERYSPAQQLAVIERRISRNIRRAVDTAFLSTSAATASTPAGILANATQVTYGSGGGFPEVIEDCSSAVANGDAEQLVAVTSQRVVLYLAALDNGATFPYVRVDGTGHIAGIPLLVSPAAGNKLIFLDASRIAKWTGTLETSMSREATVEMVDATAMNSGTATPSSSVTSLFQTNALGVLVLRRTSWIVTDVDHASYVELPVGGSPA